MVPSGIIKIWVDKGNKMWYKIKYGFKGTAEDTHTNLCHCTNVLHMQWTDLFAVTVTFFWQTTETVLGVAPLPGSTTMSHSAESLGRAALKDRPVFTVALQQIHTHSPVNTKHGLLVCSQNIKKSKRLKKASCTLYLFLSAYTEAFITNINTFNVTSSFVL